MQLRFPSLLSLYIGLLISTFVFGGTAFSQKGPRSGRKMGGSKLPALRDFEVILEQLPGLYSGEPGETDQLHGFRGQEDLLWTELDSVVGVDPVKILNEKAKDNERLRDQQIRIRSNGSITFFINSRPGQKCVITPEKPIAVELVNKIPVFRVQCVVERWEDGKKTHGNKRTQLRIGQLKNGSIYFEGSVYEKRKKWDLFSNKRKKPK